MKVSFKKPKPKSSNILEEESVKLVITFYMLEIETSTVALTSYSEKTIEVNEQNSYFTNQ